tara:strand:+ start:27 stop:815 length:789 start_codon:yes stop_codon:yes gene_type:complete
MASPIVRGQNFGSTETVTATKLQNIVDNSTFKANNGSTQAFNVSGSTDIGTCVKDGGLQVHTTGQLQVEDLKITTGKLADSSSKTTGVTFAKMQHISTAQVLGRLSASEGDVEEVGVVIGGSGDAGVLFDNDDMLDNSDTAGGSATRGATQQSIKAYVDGTVSATTNGYVKLPNGLIMQWGEYTDTSIAHGEDFNVSFPITFPTALLQVHGQPNDNAVSVISQSHADFQRIISTSTGGFTAEVGSFNGSSMNMTYKWNAIGH